MLIFRSSSSWLGWLLLLFPLLEILLFIRVASGIGFFPAFLAVIGTSLFGLHLIRSSGLSMTSIDPARLPGLLVGQGFRLLAGLLFFLPGFLSDLVGLVCLIPAVGRGLSARMAPPAAERHGNFTNANDNAPTRTGGRTVDGEFERMD